MTPVVNNGSEYDEIYWSSEDEDENIEDTTSDEDEDMKNESTKENSIDRS